MGDERKKYLIVIIFFMIANVWRVIFIVVYFSIFFLYWCSDADVVSNNISQDADNFKVSRRIVFYNWINWEYMLEIIGKCSLWNFDHQKQLTVTCKTWDEKFKKHFLGLSDNVTYFVEQIEDIKVSENFYKVIFKPSVILPDFEIR